MVYMEFHNYRQEAYAASLAKAVNKASHNVSVISTLKDRTPVPQPAELDEAEFKWGKPSSFTWGSNARDFDQGIVPSTSWEINDNPEDPSGPDNSDNEDGPEPAKEPLTDEWQEVDRKEKLVRINATDGSGAYVDFELMVQVKFKGPNTDDGREHFMILNFKGDGKDIPKKPGKGSGGSGASGVVPVGSDPVPWHYPPPVRDPDGGGASF